MQHLRAIKTSLKHLSESPLSTVMTFAVIGITLALPINLSVLLNNIKTMTHGLHDTAQISLFLKANTPEDQLKNLERLLRNDNDITSTQYITPTEGLKNFQQQLGLDNALSELKNNPLPGEIIIHPGNHIKTSLQAKQLLARLKRLPFVDRATLDMLWLQRLNAMIHLAHRIMYAIMLLFALAVLLIIGNTIRLIVQNYQEEITILKLLGGTNSFIRRPFLYSGIMYGLAGSFITILLVDLMTIWLSKPAMYLSNLYGAQFHLQGLSATATLTLFLSGIFLGYIGSWLAVSKHI